MLLKICCENVNEINSWACMTNTEVFVRPFIIQNCLTSNTRIRTYQSYNRQLSKAIQTIYQIFGSLEMYRYYMEIYVYNI